MSSAIAENGNSAVAKAGFNWLPFKIYGIGYLAIFITFLASSIWGGMTITPSDWLKKAYPSGISGKQSADAAVKLREEIYFQTAEKVPVVVLPGSRINPLIAGEFAKAIKDGRFVLDNKPITEIAIYKPGFFWNIPWQSVFTLYNLFGLFGGLFILLRTPIKKTLEENASSTAKALVDARNAQREAGELKSKYEAMLATLEAEKAEMAKTLEEEKAIEREHILKMAKHEAEGIIESIHLSIEAEIHSAAVRLQKEVAKSAMEQARKTLASDITTEDHESVLNGFIGELNTAEK